MKTIWAPLPGSQTLFLTCPVYEVLLEGTRGGKTDTLLTREDATVVAEKIKRIEAHDQRLGYEYRMNLADPSIFSKIGAEGSIGQVFRDKGVKWTEAYNAPRSRVNGAQEIIRLLAEGRLKIFNNCKHWLRTVPQLPPDSLNPEDVDTDWSQKQSCKCSSS